MKENWIEFWQREPGQFAEIISCYHKSFSGKLKKRPLKEIAQAVAVSLNAMGNAEGGTVLLGATAGGEAEGLYFDDRSRQHLIRALEKSSIPPLKFKAATEETGEKILLRFTVAPSPVIHLLLNGKCYIRIGSEKIPLSRERIALLKEARAETWHEREVLPKSSLKDLDQDLVADFIGHLGGSGEAEKILHRPYGLIEYSNGKPLLTKAAVYLFGKDPLRWHPRPGIEFVRFEGNERGVGSEYNVAERVRLEGPILKLIDEMDKFIGGLIKEKVVLRDLFFQEKFEYPAFALREALINAIAHRNYSLEGSAIEVWMFDDRLEVRSPGRLPGPVKIQQLLHQERAHYSRNPLIARVLTDRGMMRALGEGLPRIFQEMERHGLNPPEMKEDENIFSLIFRNTPIMEESTLAWLQFFRDYGLNPRQKRILAYARVHGMIFSSADYQKLGVSRDAAYIEIREMVNKGIVQPLKKHGKVYRVLEPENQAVSFPGLEWVKEALEKKGFFTFADLKQPESIPREKAISLMRELAKQGYFTISGKGRGSQYHPTETLKSLLEKKRE
ncbi:MAG: ATP-binding protein [Thermodesulfobacteriota bacterium]|nr:ATP-binding protein [Thermodesulfobacteriota bacterium]